MKRFLTLTNLFFTLLGLSGVTYAGSPIFTITAVTPVIQNMVPGSVQNLQYKIHVTNLPAKNNPMFINCALTLSPSNVVTAPTFVAANGCTAAGGAAISEQTGNDVLVNLPLNVALGTNPQTVTGALVFTQVGGKTQPPFFQTVNISITIPATTNRTVTFNNYCPFNVWFGISSGSLPANNTFNTACTEDSTCAAIQSYSKCNSNGFCGGGACYANSDCAVSSYPLIGTICQGTDNGPCGLGTCVNNACTAPANVAPCQGNSCSFCNTDADCVGYTAQGPNPGFCDATTKLCFWNNPAPMNSNYELTCPTSSQPTTNNVTFTDFSANDAYTLLWSGGFAGRTNCSTDNTPYCKTADCGEGTDLGACNNGTGFNAPSTQAEVTFVGVAPDTYDTTIINGTNIPLAIYPTNAATPQQYNNPYNCGNSGNPNSTVMNNPSSTTTLGACSWEFAPTNVSFRWVDTDGGQNCTADSGCTQYNSNFACGLRTSDISEGLSQTVCGTPLGYWNQNEICAVNNSYNQANVVNCTTTGFSGGNTLINLLQCTGPAAGTSCYTVGSTNTCCGCTNWVGSGVPIASISTLCPSTNPTTGQVVTPNPDWVGNVLPGLQFLKLACPSSYVYPFDDKASTFTCPQNGGQSAVSYNVDFCPGYKTGGIPVAAGCTLQSASH